MASSYKGLNLFGSGPHRFAMLRRGQVVAGPFGQDDPTFGSAYYGPWEVEMVVTGRLTANSDESLWIIRDSIMAQLLDPPAPGLLVDHTGRFHADMSFVRWQPGEVTDRGRLVSLAYTARFVDFKNYPQ